MITLSVLVYLPASVVTVFGLLIIATHNLLDGIQASSFGGLAPIWTILHSQGVIVAYPNHLVVDVYPLIPWVGVTAAGYGLGQVFSWTPERRRGLLLRLGIALTAAFLMLRAVNIYGDPFRWSVHKSVVFTVLSFLNTNKYPPSLLFLLMTLGPAILFLWAVDGRTPRFLRPALVVGKVPMFYYLLHVPLIHVLAIIVCYASYGQVHWMFESPSPNEFPITKPPGWGLSLPVIYLFWALVVITLYPLCRWFGALKQRRSDWWLSYF